MTDDARNDDRSRGFRKYGTPVPTRPDPESVPFYDEETEVDPNVPRSGSTSQVPTGD